MRILTLFLVIFMGMRFVQAQVPSMACPIPLPGPTWINESASSLGSTGTFTFSTDVEIDGAFTVDVGTFTFNGAEVTVVSGGDIFVNPGCTLRVINGTVITNVQNLWNGITVSPGGYLDIIDSDVCGSINAVYASNGYSSTPAEFNIENSGLRKNVTGVRVLNYNGGSYPGYIVRTHFEGGTLPAGSTFTHSYDGVVTTNVSGGTGLTIGDQSTVASANLFTRLDFGVYGINSDLEVFNNDFEDMQDISGLGGGYAVFVNTNPVPGPYALSVGTSSTRTNTMLDCRYGVYSRGMEDVNVSDNIMNRTTEPFEIGVWITRTDETIVVGENTILNYDDVGVLLDENPGSSGGPVSASVNDNIIEGTFDETRGILVDDLVGGIAIRLNQIDKVHRGIIAQSLLSASLVRIDSNRVLFGYPGSPVTQPAVGILAIQAEEPLIYQNEIEGNCPFSSGGGPCTTATSSNQLIRGIQLVRTHKALVFTNKVSYCGAGLFVLQDNLEGNAVCNEFFDTYSGVVWSSLGTGEFGETVGGAERVYGLFGSTASSDNRWTTSVPPYEPFRSISINTSDAVSVDWYYRSAATYDFPTGTILAPSGTPLTVVAGTTTAICDTLALFREGEIPGSEQDSTGFSQFREAEMDSHIAAPNPATVSNGLYTFLAAAHRSGLVHDKVQVLLGQTNIAAFAQVQDSWNQGNVDSAIALLNSLAPINTSETLLQEVWGIRLEHANSSPGAAWSEEQAQALSEIAYQDLGEAGSAAILAQSLLGLTLLPNDWYPADPEERMASELPAKTSIYPNPAQTVVYLEAGTEAANATIADLQGQVKLMIRLESETTTTLDISNLAQGIYIVQIRKDSGSSESYKLFITR